MNEKIWKQRWEEVKKKYYPVGHWCMDQLKKRSLYLKKKLESEYPNSVVSFVSYGGKPYHFDFKRTRLGFVLYYRSKGE